MPRNWVSPVPEHHNHALNAHTEENMGDDETLGERKPSQKQAKSTTIDEREAPATHTSNKSKKRHKRR